MLLPPHWSYYMSLEDDLIDTGRYVELSEENNKTYSTQFTRLLLAAGSEVDVVAKAVSSQIAPGGNHRNIDSYRGVMIPKFPAIPNIVMGIQWNPYRVKPWASWGEPTPTNPTWWRAYNAVKHERSQYFQEGNLENAIAAIAGLYCLILHLEEHRGHERPARFLRIA